MYLTALQLAARYNYAELSQIAQPIGMATVTEALLRATLEGADRSGWSAEEIEAADAAVAAIETELGNASAEIDGYLAGRYELPLIEVPKVLEMRTAQIARYHLTDDVIVEKVQEDYKAAVRWLEAVAAGRVLLTAPSGEETEGGGVGEAMFAGPAPAQFGGQRGY